MLYSGPLIKQTVFQALDQRWPGLHGAMDKVTAPAELQHVDGWVGGESLHHTLCVLYSYFLRQNEINLFMCSR